MSDPTSNSALPAEPEQAPETAPVQEIAPVQEAAPVVAPVAKPVQPPAPKRTWKQRGEKFLNMIGFENVVEALRHPDEKTKKWLVTINLMKKLGLADFAEALEHPTQKRKKILSTIFNRAADIVASKIVVMALKYLLMPIIIGTILGVSAPAYMSVGTAVVATGAFFSLYSYSRDLLLDYCRLGKEAKIFSVPRLKDAGIAFVASLATGAPTVLFLNYTEIGQTIVRTGQEMFFKSAGNLTSAFNPPASVPAVTHVPGMGPAAVPHP